MIPQPKEDQLALFQALRLLLPTHHAILQREVGRERVRPSPTRGGRHQDKPGQTRAKPPGHCVGPRLVAVAAKNDAMPCSAAAVRPLDSAATGPLSELQIWQQFSRQATPRSGASRNTVKGDERHLASLQDSPHHPESNVPRPSSFLARKNSSQRRGVW